MPNQRVLLIVNPRRVHERRPLTFGEEGGTMRRSIMVLASLASVALLSGCAANAQLASGSLPMRVGAGGDDAGGVAVGTNKTVTLDLGDGVKLEMVYVPAGEFMMGSPESEVGRDSNETQHRVILSKAFWMGKYEVTQEQWERVMRNNPSKYKGARNPVERVSWDDCQEFIKKLNGMVSGGGFRLPTEAEWEYACRAGTKTAFYNGEELDLNRECPKLGEIAWYCGIKRAPTNPVGQKKANAWGLCDMIGNVWEWCQDWHGDYPASAVVDPDGPVSGKGRVLRGNCSNDTAMRCRSAMRYANSPYARWEVFGLRLMRTL